MSDTVNASDSVQKLSKIEVQNGINDYVENKDPLMANTQGGRTTQQSVVTTAVKQRNTGPLITETSSGLGQASFQSGLVPNNSSGTFYFTFADPQGRTILVVPDVSVYIGTLAPGNLWPNASFGGGNMPIYISNSWANTDNVNVVTQVTVRNNSGSDQTIIIACRGRVITNPTTDFTAQS